VRTTTNLPRSSSTMDGSAAQLGTGEGSSERMVISVFGQNLRNTGNDAGMVQAED
jgi:hypothetical protein